MAIALATPAAAQQVNASLRGTVVADGGVTQVTVVEVNTGINRTVQVAPDGSYNFPSLRPGTYRLELTTPTGVRTTDEFQLLVAQDAVLNFDLSTVTTVPDGGDSGGIIVTADRIKTMEGGEVGTNITPRELQTLPQNNRNFLAFADLAPGVQFVNPDGQSRIQGGAQDSRTVNVFIDGVGQKDYVLKNGITGQDSSQGNPFPQLAVGEYRVISSNYKAEFDQVSSVAITAATKSGTNEFHGSAFIDYTDTSMRERRPTEIFTANPVKAETKDFQFGGALGGPIIRDIAHFFVTYEGKRRRLPVDIQPGQSFPVSYFPTEYQGLFGPTQQEFNEDLYFAKIDVSPTASDLIELSGKYRKESGIFLGNGSNAVETASSQEVDEKRGTLRWEHTTDNWINDLKVTYEDVSWSPRPQTLENGSIFTFSGVSPVTGNNLSNAQILRVGGGANFQDKGQKGWGIQNDFTYVGLPGHTIKAGVKSKWIDLTTIQQNFFNPAYSYNTNFNPNGGTFNQSIPYRVQFGYQTGTGTPIVQSNNWQFGVYIQDDWEVTPRLTLNLGVRWDYERTPSYLNFVHPADALDAVDSVLATTDNIKYPNLANANYNIEDYISTGNNRKAFTGAIQPRIGFSYDFTGDGTWVLFGGYGRSYDRNQFDFLQQEISVGSYTTRTFNFITGDPRNTCTPSPTCVPFNPVYLTQAGRDQLVAGAGAGGGRELRFINNNLKVPYSDQFSLGLRSRVSNLWTAEVGYTHIVSKDGFAYLLGNRQPNGSFFTASGGSPFGFAPPGYGSIIIGDNGLYTRSDAGYLKLNKRYTQASPWNIAATYTYTDAVENRNFGEVFALDFPSLEDYTIKPSSGLRRHRLVIAGATDTPIGLTISGKFTLASPPFLNSFNRFPGQDPALVVSALEASRGFRQLDLALTQHIPLHFITDEARIFVRLDIINAMNDRNYNSFIASTGLRNPNSFSTEGPPRTFKISAGFDF
ncbi:TonB-dependent receptor [Tsuneonella sp. YG55]|uniref:TonB-dependent receptor n=1 Tax=Tsuneonella litorea TaxID=2976475 RepID=A0A9X3ALU3_9SPHN|nr:TonB-dependent receptor [Tsuneonella litorea]MCT2559593.1 TonB-dependent receptor [Tsuneonella litorea]